MSKGEETAEKPGPLSGLRDPRRAVEAHAARNARYAQKQAMKQAIKQELRAMTAEERAQLSEQRRLFIYPRPECVSITNQWKRVRSHKNASSAAFARTATGVPSVGAPRGERRVRGEPRGGGKSLKRGVGK